MGGFASNTLVFGPGITANLVINLKASEFSHEVTTGTSNVNWSGNVVNNVVNYGTGYDTIRGNDAANRIRSYGWEPRTGTVLSGGVDVIFSAGGDDSIMVADDAGDDTVYCGDGQDTVFFDGGDELIECETQKIGGEPR